MLHFLVICVLFEAYGPISYQSYCAVTMTGNVPSHCWITSVRFFWIEVSAHGPIFIADKLSEGEVQFFIRPKVSPQEPIFTLIFVSMIKNQSYSPGITKSQMVLQHITWTK